MADPEAQQRQAAAEMQSQRLQDLNASRMPVIPTAPANPESPAPNENGENQAEEQVNAAPAQAQEQEEHQQQLEVRAQAQAAVEVKEAQLSAQERERAKQEVQSSETAKVAGQLTGLANKYPIVKAILIALKFIYTACGTNCLIALLFLMAIIGSVSGFPPIIFILPFIVPIAAALVIVFWDKIKIFVEAIMKNTSILPTKGPKK